MGKVKTYKPKTKCTEEKSVKIFLAGTIDMGKSRDWQSDFFLKMKQECEKSQSNFSFLNPRRDSGEGFDTSNKVELHNQILWESYHLDISDIIIMNLLPDSKSPISLLELGLYATSGKLLFVICPKEFYRYDNVMLTCKKYNIPLFHNEESFLEKFIEGVIKKL